MALREGQGKLRRDLVHHFYADDFAKVLRPGEGISDGIRCPRRARPADRVIHRVASAGDIIAGQYDIETIGMRHCLYCLHIGIEISFPVVYIAVTAPGTIESRFQSIYLRGVEGIDIWRAMRNQREEHAPHK